MGQLKAGQVESFIARPNRDQPVLLLYGPDSGLVSERGDAIAAKSGVDLNDPFSVIRLNADDVAADAMRLADEANTVAMFGGDRLIRISGTTRRDLTKAVAPVLNTPPEECWIIIEAGDLKRSSGLRKLVEGAAAGLALPCYLDNDAALNQLIQTEIIDQGIRLDRETQALLRSRLGSDRRASRNELQKLCLFARPKGEVTEADIRALVGDTSAFVVDDIADAAASGQVAKLEESLNQADVTDTAADRVVLATLRHFQLLHRSRVQMEAKRQSPAQIFRALRPPMHFSRERPFTDALSMWQGDGLLRAIERLEKASLDCRQNQELARAVASTTLLAIVLEARALARRGA